MGSEFLKVLIVDDEVLVRDLLKRCLNWASLGVSIVGEASGAGEAMELAEKLLPDIVFTDICMPVTDGIELSELILTKYPWIKVVIITGYEDFDYAKRSIKAGVTEYILKPINDSEISKVIWQLQAKIANEKNRDFEYEHLKQQLHDNLPFLREKFLNELMLYPLKLDTITQKLEYYDIKISNNSIQVVVIEIGDDNRGANEEERLLLQMRSCDLVKEKLAGLESVIIFSDHNQRLVIINSNDQMDINELCEAVKRTLLSQLRCALWLGVGNKGTGLEQIRTSYREACAALKYKIVTEKNDIIFYRDFYCDTEEILCLSNEQLEMFSFYLKTGMEEQAVSLMEQFFKEFTMKRKLSLERFRMIGLGIVMAILNSLTELRLETKQVFVREVSPCDQVFRIQNFPELEGYVLKLTRQTVCYINEMRHKKVNQIIREVLEYLQKNYATGELSQATVARLYYLNPSYLSRIFKQATNQTFVEYLTQLRMEKAKQFIKETDLKAYQIAERVGISDPHYFGLCFKKYTGMSVNEYKKRLPSEKSHIE